MVKRRTDRRQSSEVDKGQSGEQVQTIAVHAAMYPICLGAAAITERSRDWKDSDRVEKDAR